ncbi:MAG: calcineurin-like phosphoesterase C-terminal domain-containing protein [Hyphomicrobiaceae bacterium]
MPVDAHDPTRRHVVTGGLAAAVLGATSSATVQQVHAAGVVFHDRGKTGIRAVGDPGIADVMVSNGVDVTLTDGQGQWQLPARAGEPIFVIKPSDWSLPIGTNGLPVLSNRIDTATALEAIDFALRRDVEPRRFDVALLADTQPQTMQELGYLRDSVLSAVVDTGAAFAINHGDIVFDRPDLHARYLDLIASTAMPWHHCPGNHDMNAGGPAACFETWKATFGPCHYAFQYGGATFILLNNVARLPQGDLTAGGYNYVGRIGREQLTFVEGVLRHVPRDSLIVVSMHIPLVAWEDPLEPSGFTADRQALLALLSGRPNTLSLAGHTHTTEHHYLGPADGFSGPGQHHHHVLTAACGSWWSGPFDAAGQPIAMSRDGTPKGFHVLEVDGAGYRTRLVPVGHSGSAHMRISLEGRDAAGTDDPPRRIRLSPCVTTGDCAATLVAVNVFDGGPKTRLAGRIIGRTRAGEQLEQALALAHTAMPDVAVDELYLLHRAQLKPWVETSPSSHIWRAALPRLPAGTYAVHIDGRDAYGGAMRSNLLLEVVG